MQVLFNKFDYAEDYTPWTNLMGKTGNNYNRSDSEFDKEIVNLRNKLATQTQTQSITASNWDCVKEKAKEHVETLKKYCDRKESENLNRNNLASMKGYMVICYDMSEIWYFT